MPGYKEEYEHYLGQAKHHLRTGGKAEEASALALIAIALLLEYAYVVEDTDGG